MVIGASAFVVGVGAFLEEDFGDRGVSAMDGPVESSESEGIFNVDVGTAVFEEDLGNPPGIAYS